MKTLVSRLWQICLLRAGPEELPADRRTMFSVVALATLVTLLSALVASKGDAAMAAGLTVLSVGMEIIALRALVAFKSVPERFGTALVGVFGTDILLTLLTSPKYLALLLPQDSPVLPVAQVAELILLGWALGVQGLIYHRTLNIGPFQANALVFALMMLTYFIGAQLYPELLSGALQAAPASPKS